MQVFQLSRLPLSVKVLITTFLFVLAVTYAALALHIYIDTEFKVSLIGEAYSLFEWIELCDQTHHYWPYYALWLFALPLSLFVVGGQYSEKLKISLILAFVVCLIFDIGSMWAIPYIHTGIFAWALFLAGLGLAAIFGTLMLCILYDVWLREMKRNLK